VPSQEQSAGAESQLLQAGRDIIVSGLSAADVVEITRREVARVVEELTLSAKTVAEERVQALGNRILERFAATPEHLSAFGDPDFQFSLNDAGRSAASNDDVHTEDLLVDLLANRAEAGNTSRVRLATSQAIRAADKLSVETLNGLTALWSLSFLTATAPDNVAAHAASARNVAEAVAALPLPDGLNWLQEAEALNLVRGYGGGLLTRRPYREMYQERAAAHLVQGISQEQLNEFFEASGDELPDLAGKVVPHPLKPGHLKLHGENREQFLELFGDTASSVPRLEELIGLNGFGGRDAEAIRQWNALLDQSPAVAVVETWWNAAPYVDLTLVGRVIGFVNAKRHIGFEGAQTVAEFLGGN
jgi:hypothetical protein